jgi:hypothetical protein
LEPDFDVGRIAFPDLKHLSHPRMLPKGFCQVLAEVLLPEVEGSVPGGGAEDLF